MYTHTHTHTYIGAYMHTCIQIKRYTYMYALLHATKQYILAGAIKPTEYLTANCVSLSLMHIQCVEMYGNHNFTFVPRQLKLYRFVK